MLVGLCIGINFALTSTFNDETNNLHYSFQTSVINENVKNAGNEPENYNTQRSVHLSVNIPQSKYA